MPNINRKASLNSTCFVPKNTNKNESKVTGSRGRVVKATDLKSVSVYPLRFEPCQLRRFALRFFVNILQYNLIKSNKIKKQCQVVVAERLRRQTRNLLGSPRAGSNPADYVNFLFYFVLLSMNTEISFLLAKVGVLHRSFESCRLRTRLVFYLTLSFRIAS